MKEMGKNPVISILTDFDPSGIFIEQDYRVKVHRYGGDAKFVRIAMNPDQIAKYDIPSIPHDDPKAERVRKDPRYPKFLEMCNSWGVDPNIVELDAFVGLKPREFRKLVVDSIEKYFDREIYEKAREIEEERVEQVEQLRRKIIEFSSTL